VGDHGYHRICIHFSETVVPGIPEESLQNVQPGSAYLSPCVAPSPDQRLQGNGPYSRSRPLAGSSEQGKGLEP